MVKTTELYLRNIIFGISDSLVSTVGLLAGIDAAGTPRQAILLTGIVYAFVEAFSMAVGSFLSEQSAEEYEVKGETAEAGAVHRGRCDVHLVYPRVVHPDPPLSYIRIDCRAVVFYWIFACRTFHSGNDKRQDRTREDGAPRGEDDVARRCGNRNRRYCGEVRAGGVIKKYC